MGESLRPDVECYLAVAGDDERMLVGGVDDACAWNLASPVHHKGSCYWLANYPPFVVTEQKFRSKWTSYSLSNS